MRYTEYERMRYFRVGQAWSDRKLCAVRNVASLVAAVVVYELTVPISLLTGRYSEYNIDYIATKWAGTTLEGLKVPTD